MKSGHFCVSQLPMPWLPTKLSASLFRCCNPYFCNHHSDALYTYRWSQYLNNMTRWLFHLCPDFFQWQFLRLSRLWSPDVATVQMYRDGSTPCMPPKFQSNLRNSIFARGEIFLQLWINFPVLSICLSRLHPGCLSRNFCFYLLLLALLFGRQSLPGNVNHTLTQCMWLYLHLCSCESQYDPV